jgi:hypothetical protein
MPEVELTQEQIDKLVSHLEEQEIQDVALFEAMERLPDLEHGKGEVADDVGGVCVLCDEPLTGDDEAGERFGKFVHISCAKKQDPSVEVKEKP